MTTKPKLYSYIVERNNFDKIVTFVIKIEDQDLEQTNRINKIILSKLHKLTEMSDDH